MADEASAFRFAVPAPDDRVMVAERQRLDLYADRAALFDRAAARADRQSRLISSARVVTFAGAAAAAAAGLWQLESPRPPLLVAAALAIAAFLGLVIAHAHVEARQRWNQTRARHNRDQAARVKRNWDSVPRADCCAAPSDHLYALDLDLAGRASLIDLLGAPATPAGRRLLTAWLLAPSPAGTIRRRQAGVAELAPELEFRQQVHALGTLAAFDPARLDRFIAWAEESPWLLNRPWLIWLSRVLPAATAALAAAAGLGLVPGAWWMLPLVGSVVLWYAAGRRLRDTFDRIESHGTTRDHAERLFRVVRGHGFRSEGLIELAAALGTGPAAADAAFARLGRLTALADLRHSSLIHFPVNAVTLWDLHVLLALEKWRAARGAAMRRWFEILGEMEALSALAGLSHDNPDWCLPEIAGTGRPILEADDLAHPLLPSGSRVANHVTIGPPGRFLFVTGSNMSGKSTLLRAVGLNVALALAGGPVCASSLRLPLVDLRTVMRVQDSLELGISYFMASLERLRRVVVASPGPGPDAPVLLYLLDEILQGTNTAERQIAVRTILRSLLARPAIGALTSHDLTLADADDLSAAADAVHFTEAVDGADAGARLSFDYRLRPGVATSQNALKLMRIIGLGDAATPEGRRGGPR